nr:uncharacterized protein LOC120973445 [Aegilops tauschii subsp. strangulata]
MQEGSFYPACVKEGRGPIHGEAAGVDGIATREEEVEQQQQQQANIQHPTPLNLNIYQQTYNGQSSPVTSSADQRALATGRWCRARRSPASARCCFGDCRGPTSSSRARRFPHSLACQHQQELPPRRLSPTPPPHPRAAAHRCFLRIPAAPALPPLRVVPATHSSPLRFASLRPPPSPALTWPAPGDLWPPRRGCARRSVSAPTGAYARTRAREANAC